MSIIEKVAERKIKEAMAQGEFEDLPGRGEKIKFEDDRHIPEDLRMAYKILKNANCVPPELTLKKEIRQVEDLLNTITDEKEKYKQLKRLNFLVMKLNMTRECPVQFEENERYYEQLVEKFSKGKGS